MFSLNDLEIFPNKLSDILQFFAANASQQDKDRLEEMLSFKKLNHIDRPNVLCLSLFYKDVDDVIPTGVVTEDDIKNNILGSKRNKWREYFESILHYGPKFMMENPSIKIRVYLEPDCSFFAERLAEFAEVYVMNRSSISAQPGAMWRMLALEDTTVDKVVCWDADYMNIVNNSLKLFSSNADFFKYYNGSSTLISNNLITYRFIQCGMFGSTRKLPISEYIKAFIFYNENKKIINHLRINDNTFNFFGTTWPYYGFDEWFTHNVLQPITLQNSTEIFIASSTLPNLKLNEFILHELIHGKDIKITMY